VNGRKTLGGLAEAHQKKKNGNSLKKRRENREFFPYTLRGGKRRVGPRRGEKKKSGISSKKNAKKRGNSPYFFLYILEENPQTGELFPENVGVWFRRIIN
jgi:hypothetical protein